MRKRCKCGNKYFVEGMSRPNKDETDSEVAVFCYLCGRRLAPTRGEKRESSAAFKDIGVLLGWSGR